MEELSEEAIFEKQYEDYMLANEQEQNDFEAFFTRSEEDYKRYVVGTINNYCSGLERLFVSNDRKIDDMLNKITRRVTGQ